MTSRKRIVETHTLPTTSGIVDVKERSHEGEVEGHPFTAWVTGLLSCFRVPDRIRDQMRVHAAEVFLAERRVLHLTRDEVRYWDAIRHKSGV